MFYQTSGSRYGGDKRRAEEARPGASLRSRSPEAVQQAEWLGWDGWVNPEPFQTEPRDSTTVV